MRTKTLTIGTMGLAGVVTTGLFAFPLSAAFAGDDDAAVKRNDDTPDLVLVADDDDDDTNARGTHSQTRTRTGGTAEPTPATAARALTGRTAVTAGSVGTATAVGGT